MELWGSHRITVPGRGLEELRYSVDSTANPG